MPQTMSVALSHAIVHCMQRLRDPRLLGKGPADLPFRLHLPSWYSRQAVATQSSAVRPPPSVGRRRYQFTRAQRRQGGLTRAGRMTPLERSLAAMQASRARWRAQRWASPAARRLLGQALLQARRTPKPRRDALIPAAPPRPGVTHPSHAPRPCWCGAEARPYRRAPLLTNVWEWRCAAHAFGPGGRA
jgi:hypothetical protein